MAVLLAIPARFASARFPGKPLAELRGASGGAKSLIRRTWEAACEVSGADRVVVATDDDRIAAAADGFGAEVVMTPSDCANGTERCAAVLDGLDQEFDIVVNLQGDAPLTPPWFIESLIGAMKDDPGVMVATPVLCAGPEMCRALRDDRRAGRVGATTAVFDRRGDALYFSKEVIPFGDSDGEIFHHVGVYGYRPAALTRYRALPPGRLELAEGLEQLRFLENGIAVRCVQVDDRGRPFWEVNNPEDIPAVEKMMADIGLI